MAPNVNNPKLTQKRTGSGSADINNIGGSSQKANPYKDITPFNVSRISPSNGNIGSGLTMPMDLKYTSVFNTAYGNGNKYYTGEYANGIDGLYPSTNYASSGKSGGFWNGLTKFLGIAMTGFMGFGLVSSIISMIKGNKAEKASKSQGEEDVEIKDARTKGSKEEVKINSDELKKDIESGKDVKITNPDDLDKLDIKTLTTYKSNLEKSVTTLKTDYENAPAEIQKLQQEKAAKEKQLSGKKEARNQKQKAAGDAQTALNDASKALQDSKDAVVKIQKDVSDIGAKITSKELKLAELKAANKDTTALQAEINELKQKLVEAKKALQNANNFVTENTQKFKEAGDASKKANQEAEAAAEEYDNLKQEIDDIDNKIKELEQNQKKYPKEVGERQALIEMAGIKIGQKEQED